MLETSFLQYSAVISCVQTSSIADCKFSKFVGCFSATLSFRIVHKFSLGFKSGLLPGQSSFYVIFHQEICHNCRTMTRSTIFHKYITNMKLHVKLELFFQQVKIFLPIHGSVWRQKEEAGASFCRHPFPHHDAWRMFNSLLGVPLIKSFPRRSSNCHPASSKLLDSRFIRKQHFCPLLFTSCYMLLCKLQSLSFHGCCKSGFLAGLCDFKLNCLTRR